MDNRAPMETTKLEIPTELLEAAKLSPEEVRAELAIRLYQTHRLNEAQARELAGSSQVIETLAWSNRETGRINMDDFLSWASHDLKSPLNTIIGFTRVVIKGIDGPLNETQTADLTTAFTSSQRMLFLLNNLVDMARLNTGQITLQKAECDMPSLFEETVERWKTANPSVQLNTKINISQATQIVDKLHLRQIVSTLLTYASLRITKGSLYFSVANEKDHLNFTIQSIGTKSVDKFELDSAMLSFVGTALIKLHGGDVAIHEDTDSGLLIGFYIPYSS